MSKNLTTKIKQPGSWHFDNSYARLSELLFARIKPEPVKAPKMLVFNYKLAEELGLQTDELIKEKGFAVFAGNEIPIGADPIAQAYAGHQFAHFTMLGDGRAVVLGEHITPVGRRFDLQLKGSGRTPFSRNGDGRAALGPMLREYILSEAMCALGIPTTRSLAVVATGENVLRENILPGAILTRIAESHIRVGTFEYVARCNNFDLLKKFADYTINRHYSDQIDEKYPYLVFFKSVIERQASLIAKWLQVGFIHGVMNTDNMAISGETIDYGPCAFIDVYNEATVFSSIDRNGRYSYGNQARIAQWNLARLAEAILPILDPDPQIALGFAEEAVQQFADSFNQHWFSGMRKKLGLFNQEHEDLELIKLLLNWMQNIRADFTNTFRALAVSTIPEAEIFQGPDFSEWHARWQARLKRQTQSLAEVFEQMNAINPVIIPRNHNVEEALKAATEEGNFSVMNNLLSVLSEPFKETAQNTKYRLPPPAGSGVYKTFCGT